MKVLSNKEKVVERLRLERQKSEQDWFDCGKSDGLKDAEDLSYDDFNYLDELYQSKAELEMHGSWITLNQFNDDLQEFLKEKMERMERYDTKTPEEVYLAGWIEGVMEFWDEIKDEI